MFEMFDEVFEAILILAGGRIIENGVEKGQEKTKCNPSTSKQGYRNRLAQVLLSE